MGNTTNKKKGCKGPILVIALLAAIFGISFFGAPALLGLAKQYGLWKLIPHKQETEAAGGTETETEAVTEAATEVIYMEETEEPETEEYQPKPGLQEDGTYYAEETPDTWHLVRTESEDTEGNADGDDADSTDAQKVSYTGWEAEAYTSSNMILIEEESGQIVAEEDAYATISPASMTKMLTVLTAYEQLGDERLDEEVEISEDAVGYAYIHECSIVGWEIGEKVSIRDLFYGTILPSGGEAAVQLAITAGGTYDDFINLMNEKAKELGIGETSHFTNPVGIYDEDLYSTVYDMAIIMQAAESVPFVREVLSTHIYQVPKTEEHPDGISLSNLFLRRIEDKETPGMVLCAKTGFVNQSRSCAASYFIADNGKTYIAVTVGGASSWKCIADHVLLYNTFVPATEEGPLESDQTQENAEP